MKEIPDVISSKDFLYLSNLFEQNFNLSKIAYNYSQILDNNDFKSVLETISNIHKQYCLKIINLLEGGINEQ